MTESLFKVLNAKNWLEPDPRSLAELTKLSDKPEEWIGIILEPTLNDDVPVEVVTLFVAAQVTMVYGYFHYILYALGVDRLCRIAEAAITLKFEAMNGPQSKKYLSQKIPWLIEEGVIPTKLNETWANLRQMRNIVSHPRYQMPFPVSLAIEFLRSIAEIVNLLYE